MIMCERDQNFSWAHRLFDYPLPSTGCYAHPNGYADGNYYDHHYPRDASHPDETHLHSSALTYGYYNPSVDMYHHGNVGGQEHEAVYVDPPSSSSYPSSHDCSEMEEEVGKRFYDMVPVPHVPKINGEIPSFDEATMDHERLSDRLRVYDLVEHKVKGDGNCQFRALSDQLYQTPDHHEFVREQILSQLKSNRDAYDGYVPMAYDEYLDKLSRNGEWGDHVTLQAAADKYGVKIFVMTSFKDTCYIEIQPKVVKSNKVVLLSFWAEVHYNSIFPQNVRWCIRVTRAPAPPLIARKKREEQERLDAEEADYRRVWEQGNELFYKGKYQEAADHYTEAMKKNPNEHAVFRNRAQCHIFLGALRQGLEDAEKCIELDSTYQMGYVCKAKVQALMQDYESAMATYIEGLKCDPTNHIVIDGFKRCMTCIERSKGSDVGREGLNDILRDWHSDIALCTELKKNMEEVAVLKKEASDEHLRRIESERMDKISEANQVQRQKEAAEFLSKIQQELQQVKARQYEVTDELQKANKHNEHVQNQLLETKKRHMEELQKANEHSQNVEQQFLESKKHHTEELQKAHVQNKNVQHQLSESKERYNQLQSKHDHLLKERDAALKEVEKLRQKISTAMPCQFSPSELECATKNFSASLKIREFGFGSVYEGDLRNMKVAIKVLRPDGSQGCSQFEQEVAIHGRVRHPNLVTLLGACSNSSMLVYEFLPNGSLEDFLGCADKRRTLTWQIRVRVIAEICSALIFLHENKPDPIVHGDLRPANILLDANFVSKLSDFGISHTLIKPKSKSTKQPVENPAYMDPEYLSSGKMTPHSDVYSFGIVILRLLTGKSSDGIRKIVEDAVEQNNLNSVLDISLRECPDVHHIHQLAYDALSCTEQSSKSRPVLSGQFWTTLERMRDSTMSSSLSSSSSVWAESSAPSHLWAESSAPSHFICAMTLDIMKEPHLAADGFTYEGEWIRQWLEDHNTSPLTGLPLPNRELIPNLGLRSAIKEWQQQK